MNYEKIITEMKSVREFTNKKADIDLVAMIIDNLEKLKKMNDEPLDFVIMEDGKSFSEEFEGKIGYFGKMIEAPSYLLVFGKNSYGAKVNVGYCLEWIRFSLHNSGIGSCWISTLKDVDYTSLFSRTDGLTLIGCLGFGEEYKGILKKNTEKISERKGIADFVYKDQWKNEVTWEELEQLGLSEAFYLTKLAPSWGNEQPWTFLIESNACKLYIDVEKAKNYGIEVGIISLYFVKACESKGLKIDGSLISGLSSEKSYGSYECQVIFTM